MGVWDMTALTPATRLLSVILLAGAAAAAHGQTRAGMPAINRDQGAGIPAALPPASSGSAIGTRAAIPARSSGAAMGTRITMPQPSGGNLAAPSRLTMPGPRPISSTAIIPQQQDWRLKPQPAPGGSFTRPLLIPSAPATVASPSISPSARATFCPPQHAILITRPSSGLSGGSAAAIVSSASFVEASGFAAQGQFSDGRFRLAFHLGSPIGRHHDWCPRPPRTICPDVIYPIGFPWWYGNYGSPRIYGTSYGTYAAYDPSLVSTMATPTYEPMQEMVTPSSERELADAYLRAGDVRAAAKSYRAHLGQFPTDAGAMRGLALALLEASQFSDAAAMMSLAYHTDPGLVNRPVPEDVYAGGARELRDNLNRASVYANRVQTPSAWLMLAVLMQAEDRPIPARTVIDRAAAAGLDREIVEPFRSAL
jgi:hypothetical protein